MSRSATILKGLTCLLIGPVVLSLSLSSSTWSQSPHAQIGQLQKGIDYARRKEFESARAAFKKVLAQQAENAAALNNLANLDLFEGKYASAMRKYWKASQYDSEDTNINLGLGIVYYLQMEITPSHVFVGNQKSSTPKEDWQALSERAFDKAFKNIKSAKEACKSLGIPSTTTPEYSWVQNLLKKAAERANKSSEFRMGGGRAKNQRKIPAYWKID